MNEEFEGLNLVELYDLLEEVPEPPAIALTPQTLGWIVLGGLVVLLFLLCGWWIHKRWQANAYRRAALHELDQAGDDPAAIAKIIRRAALVAYPRSDIVRLTGESWLEFLDSTYPGSAFSSGAGRIVSIAPYRPQPATSELRAVARDWLRKHRPPE